MDGNSQKASSLFNLPYNSWSMRSCDTTHVVWWIEILKKPALCSIYHIIADLWQVGHYPARPRIQRSTHELIAENSRGWIQVYEKLRHCPARPRIFVTSNVNVCVCVCLYSVCVFPHIFGSHTHVYICDLHVCVYSYTRSHTHTHTYTQTHTHAQAFTITSHLDNLYRI